MSGKNLLIVTFPVEKGLDIRSIITKHDSLFHHKKWERDGDLCRFIGDLSRPDTDDEGSNTRFLYDVDGVKLEMERIGATVVL